MTPDLGGGEGDSRVQWSVQAERGCCGGVWRLGVRRGDSVLRGVTLPTHPDKLGQEGGKGKGTSSGCCHFMSPLCPHRCLDLGCSGWYKHLGLVFCSFSRLQAERQGTVRADVPMGQWWKGVGGTRDSLLVKGEDRPRHDSPVHLQALLGNLPTSPFSFR